MPYVSKKDREYIDWYLHIENLADHIRMVPSGKLKGAANYVISRIVLRALKPESGWSYTSISEVISVLRDAADEIERRLMGPREDMAIQVNGDLPEYIEDEIS